MKQKSLEIKTQLIINDICVSVYMVDSQKKKFNKEDKSHRNIFRDRDFN